MNKTLLKDTKKKKKKKTYGEVDSAHKQEDSI